MSESDSSSAKKRIIDAYNTVRQTYGDGTMVKQVARFLGRKVDQNGGNSWIRRVIKEYEKSQVQDS